MKKSQVINRRIVLLLVVATFLGAIAPASAAKITRTDVVWLKNGDRITCSVKELDRGMLRVTTDHMGTILIDWIHVKSIDTANTYEVELESGEKHWGDLAPGIDSSNLTVQSQEGSEELSLDKIVHVTEIKRTFVERLDGSIDFGLNARKANGEINYTFSGEATHRARKNEAALSYSSILSKRNDLPEAFRDVLDATWTHFLGKRWHIMGLGKLERNDELGLDLRMNVGAAVGRQIIQTNRSRLSVTGGLTTNTENFVLDPETQHSLEAMIMTSYDFFIHGDLGADLSTTLSLLPNLTESGRYRLEYDASYRHEIVLDLFVRFSGWYSYDSGAPIAFDETASQSDYGVVTSLGWMF